MSYDELVASYIEILKEELPPNATQDEIADMIGHIMENDPVIDEWGSKLNHQRFISEVLSKLA